MLPVQRLSFIFQLYFVLNLFYKQMLFGCNKIYLLNKFKTQYKKLHLHLIKWEKFKEEIRLRFSSLISQRRLTRHCENIVKRAEVLSSLYNNKKLTLHRHGKIPKLLKCWADLVVHILLQKSSVHSLIQQSPTIFNDQFVKQRFLQGGLCQANFEKY